MKISDIGDEFRLSSTSKSPDLDNKLAECKNEGEARKVRMEEQWAQSRVEDLEQECINVRQETVTKTYQPSAWSMPNNKKIPHIIVESLAKQRLEAKQQRALDGVDRETQARMKAITEDHRRQHASKSNTPGQRVQIAEAPTRENLKNETPDLLTSFKNAQQHPTDQTPDVLSAFRIAGKQQEPGGTDDVPEKERTDDSSGGNLSNDLDPSLDGPKRDR